MAEPKKSAASAPVIMNGPNAMELLAVLRPATILPIPSAEPMAKSAEAPRNITADGSARPGNQHRVEEKTQAPAAASSKLAVAEPHPRRQEVPPREIRQEERRGPN